MLLSLIACVRHCDFSDSVFLENQLPRTSTGCKDWEDISASMREEIFWRNSAGVPTDFPCVEYRRKTENADDVTGSKTGRKGILRAMSGRNKGSKKVLRLSKIRCRGPWKQSRHRGQLLARCNEYGGRVPLVCNSIVITLSHDCTVDSIESTIVWE